MTCIEFFEKDASENICTCLTMAPNRMILIGDKMKHMQKHIERYKRILSNRGIETEFLCRTVNKNNMQSIIDALSQIIETYDDCVFDLTGGEDLYLVAMGIVFERYKDKGVQMHHFNIRNGTIIDCDQDGHTLLEDESIKLSVEENIRIYGGEIVYEYEKENATISWNMIDDFKEDIDKIWEICKTDVRLWNTQMGVFAAAEEVRDQTYDELTTVASVPCIINILENVNGKYVTIWRILNGLMNAGLLTAFECDDETFSITYKNVQVKLCLTKAGQALEMKMYKAALEASEKNGSLTYNDVMTGVYIDWDGDIHTEQDEYDTENEIDVMMMHGLVPVFVSCKNGYVDIDELYKLHSVADRFGGKYAKKILIATALGSNDFSEYLRQRAKDMSIRLVEGIQDMDDTELNKVIRTFWTN